MSTANHIEAIKAHLATRYSMEAFHELSLYGTLSGTDSGGIFTTWTYFRIIDENLEVIHMGAVSAETNPMRAGITLLVWASTEYLRIDE
jgi:hypothetical protein